MDENPYRAPQTVSSTNAQSAAKTPGTKRRLRDLFSVPMALSDWARDRVALLLTAVVVFTVLELIVVTVLLLVH